MEIKPVANTVYKLWLGLYPFGKSTDFPKLVIFGEVRAKTRHSSYTQTLCPIKKFRFI